MAAPSACAGKSTGIALLAITLAAIAVSRFFLNQKSIRPLFSVFCLLLVSLLVGGFWYARNYYYTGSPLFPAGLTVAGHTVFPGQSIQTIMHAEYNIPRVMRDWSPVHRIAATWAQFAADWPATVTIEDSRYGGLGFLWLLCLPAIIYTAISSLRRSNSRSALRVAATDQREVDGANHVHKSASSQNSQSSIENSQSPNPQPTTLSRRPSRDQNSKLPFVLCPLPFAFIFLFSATTALLLITPSNWWPRYTLWIYALGLPSLAFTLSALTRNPRRISNFALYIFAFAFLIAAAEALVCLNTLLSHSLAPDPLLTRNTQPASPNHKSSISNFNCEIPFAALRGTAFDAIFDSTDAVAVGPLVSQFDKNRWSVELLGVLSMPIGGRTILALPKDPTPADIALAARQAKWVIWDNSLPIPTSLTFILQPPPSTSASSTSNLRQLPLIFQLIIIL